MTRIRIIFALCVAVFATAGLTVSGAGAKQGDKAAAGETELFAFLSGKNEKPAGDADGHARAFVTLKAATGTICYDLRKFKLETAQAAHIHKGKAGVAGPVVVAFFSTTTGAGKGKITGCVKHVSKKLIGQIAANPAGYYVNIHTIKFPAGSVRGQLGPHT